MSERPRDVYFGNSGNEAYYEPSWAANRIAELEAENVKLREQIAEFIDGENGPNDVAEWEQDSKRMDRLEEAYWFSLTTLPDGRKILRIQIHEDLIGYQPETGEMTVRELLDNEEPGLKMFEYLNAEDAEEDYQKTLDKLGENWQGEEQNHE